MWCSTTRLPSPPSVHPSGTLRGASSGRWRRRPPSRSTPMATAVRQPRSGLCCERRASPTPGGSMLLEDADPVLPKPATDIVVTGHAHAPAGKPVRELTAALLVGPVRKTLVVGGDRTWEGRRPSLSAPEPFVRMPLTYERAFGGVDQRRTPGRGRAQRRGRGFVTEPAMRSGSSPPTSSAPDALHQPANPPPAGFGPLAPSGSPRLELAGTHDGRGSPGATRSLPATRSPALTAPRRRTSKPRGTSRAGSPCSSSTSRPRAPGASRSRGWRWASRPTSTTGWSGTARSSRPWSSADAGR